MGECLTDGDLRLLHAGELGEEEVGRMQTHLQSCRSCAWRDADLVALHDTWVQRLRQVGLPSDGAGFGSRSIAGGYRPGLIAGYDMVEEINRGGQGIVYRAIQQSTKRETALKVLREGPFASKAARKRFEREVELAASLRHPNIVAVFDSGVTADGRHYCVMDYVRGQRLDAYVRERRLKLDQALRLFATVCEAVNYAHQRGVIHRDLKPSNILVDAQGQAQVLDFGLAKHTNEGVDTQVTAASLVLGTLPYLSPEQARGRHDEMDIRSDVYALGVILYELLTGEYPYPVAGEMSTVLRHIAETSPTPPGRTLRRSRAKSPLELGRKIGLDDEIETIVLKALAKERERRYQTAGELARDIGHYLAGEPIEAKRDSHWYVVAKTLRRHWISASAAAMFVVVVAGSSIALAVMYRSQGMLLEEVQRQKAVAESAEARANRRFGELRKLARAFIFDFDPMISNLTGALPARELLLKTALEYLNSLAEDVPPQEMEMRLELGTAYFRIGNIQGDPNRETLHDPDGAIESYMTGLSFLEPIVEAKPEDVMSGRMLWNAYSHVAELHESIGRCEEGDRFFEKARALNMRLLASHPEDANLERERIMDIRAEARTLAAKGRSKEALALLKSAKEVLDRLLEQDPDDDSLRHDMASTLAWEAQMMEAGKEFGPALALRERSLQILEKLAAENPHVARFQNDYCTGLERYSNMLQAQGQNREALDIGRRALQVAKTLTELEPGNLMMNANLRSAYCRVGEQEMALGQIETAKSHFDQYHETSKQAMQSFPSDSRIRRDLAVSFYKFAEYEKHFAQVTEKSPPERRAHWRDARRQLEQCLAEFERMRDEGQIWESDRGVPDELSVEIADCDKQIKAIQDEE